MKNELTEEQIIRQDDVDTYIYNMLMELNPNKCFIQPDLELVGRVRDVIQEVLVYELQVCTETEFYPYIDESEIELPFQNDKTK